MKRSILAIVAAVLVSSTATSKSLAFDPYEALTLTPSNSNQTFPVMHNSTPAGKTLTALLELCVLPTSVEQIDIYFEGKFRSSIGTYLGTGNQPFLLGCTTMMVKTGQKVEASVPSGNQTILLRKITQVH